LGAAAADCEDPAALSVDDDDADAAFGPPRADQGGSTAGRTFTDWTRLLTAGGVRIVVVNGQRSRVFAVGGGSPQGCPYSPLSLCLLQATLAIMLKHRLRGQGLQLPDGTELIVIAFADDQQLFGAGPTRDAAAENLRQAVDIVDAWSTAIGMKLNRGKSEGTWLTSATLPPPAYAVGDHASLAWQPASTGIKCVGTRIGVHTDQGWTQLLAKVVQRLQRWSHVKLGYRGRVMVVLAMATSVLWYTAAVWPMPPAISAKLCAAVRMFFWAGRVPLDADESTPPAAYSCRTPLKWADISRPESEGGFNMWNPAQHATAILAKWPARYLEPGHAPWKTLPRHWLQQATGVASGGADAILVNPDKCLRRGQLGDTRPRTSTAYPPPPLRWRHYINAWSRATEHAVRPPPDTCECISGHCLWHNKWLPGLAGEWMPARTDPAYAWMQAGVHRVEQIYDTTPGSAGWVPLADIKRSQQDYARTLSATRQGDTHDRLGASDRSHALACVDRLEATMLQRIRHSIRDAGWLLRLRAGPRPISSGEWVATLAP
jgi:hypothetical protein